MKSLFLAAIAALSFFAAIAALSLGIGTVYAAPAQQQTNPAWHLGSHSYAAFGAGGDGAAG